MRVDIVDPPAFTPPYDRALCAALARSATHPEVRLATSRFDYGTVPAADGFAVDELFYRRGAGKPGSRARRLSRLLDHVPGMLRYRRAAAGADVSHFQWLAAQLVDVHLLPRHTPVVITAHDVLPREPRAGQLRAQRRLYERADAVVVHSEHGRQRLAGLGIGGARVIPHGAFRHLDGLEPRLPPELRDDGSPVVALVGLLRPYKGLDVLYEAWGAGIADAQLWVCGMPRMPLPRTPSGAQLVPRFIADEELAGVLRRADLVVLPYTEIDQSGVLFCALGLGRPVLLSAVGGFPEIAALGAARAVPPNDPAALRAGIELLLTDESERVRLAAGARAAADGALSWDAAAAAHMALYEELV